MSQLTYSIDMSAGQDGLIYDIGFNDFITGLAEETVIPGVLVVKGTSDKQVLLPASVAAISNPLSVRGFVTRDVAHEMNASGNLSYAAEVAVSVMTKGRMWMVCEDAFETTDSVFVRHTASGGNAQLGRIRTDADTATAAVLLGAKILNSGDAGALALVQFDLI